MKTLRFIPRLPAKALTCLALVTMAAGLAQAQPFTNFNSGSTGTVDLIITSNTTITLPPEGILHYRSISISNGATVKFTRNPLNTPVYLLAQSNVVINGTIDVSGENPSVGRLRPGFGGPGGFDGGGGGLPQIFPGDGKGPGGGRGDNGFASFTNYGNALCSPLVGGSGGAGYSFSGGIGGGGGGGAILIASSAVITIGPSGEVRSLGNIYLCSAGGMGCGGMIRLVAPTINGSGTVSVSGQSGCNGTLSAGGRIRIDSFERFPGASLQYGTVRAASLTRGSQMFVFPQTNLLTIANVTVGANSYSLNTTNPASISLPAGPAITNAIVEVRAEGQFYGATTVPIAVVVTPENGASGTYTNTINLAAGSTNVTVTIPAGTTSTLHVWTR